MSKGGQVWQCQDSDNELYLIVADKHEKIIGELWLTDGTLSDSRGHSKGCPDKDQKFVAESIYNLIQPLPKLS